MDISPVSAIRPVTLIRPSSDSPDLSRVTETENRRHSGEDEYTSADSKAGRGLEDEEDEPASESPAGTPADSTSSPSLSVFA